jgi:hypothetical protein
MTRIAFAMLLVLGFSALAHGQDINSGPPEGKKLPALTVQAKSGPEDGKKLDYVAQRNDKPTIYLVIPKETFGRPIHRFMKELGDGVAGKGGDHFVVAVFLAEDKDQLDQYLPKLANYYQATALTYFPGDKAGPEGWDINDQAEVTVVIGKDGKVAARLGYTSVNETIVPEVIKALTREKKE